MLGKYEGKEFVLLSKTEQGILIGRIYVIGTIVYQTLAATRKDNANSPDIQKFLNSFKILIDPAKASEEWLSFGKNFASYVVDIEAYDRKGVIVEKGKGFLTDKGEVYTTKSLLQKSSSAVIKTTKGETYQVKGVIADYVEGRIVKLVPEKPIEGVKTLIASPELPTKNDLVTVISNQTKEILAVFKVSNIYSFPELKSVHFLSLDLKNKSGELEETIEGSPIINSEGKLAGMVTRAYKISGTNELSVSAECMDFTSTETNLEQPLGITEWLGYVLEREREKHKNEPGVVLAVIYGGVISSSAPSIPTPTPIPKPEEPKEPPITPCDEYTIRNIVITEVAPEYPIEAKQNHIEGQVIVKLLINEQGQITKAQAVSGHKLLQKAALDAAKQWTFRRPVIKEPNKETPTKVSSQLTFSFALSD